MDDRRHQAQDAACTLKFVEARPIIIKPAEEFRMNGVGGREPALVVPFPAARRKLLRLPSVQVGKGPDHRISGGEELRIGDRLEEAAPHDLEALFSVRWPPR